MNHVDELWSSPAPYQWLIDRGLTKETIWDARLGFDPRRNRIRIPYFRGGEEYSQRWRMLDADAKPKYRSDWQVPASLFNIEGTAESVVYLTEGEFDALILKQLGVNSVGVPGAKAFRRDWRWLFRSSDLVVICMDADEAGQRADNRIKAWLGGIVELRQMELPDGMDVTDVYVNRGERALRGLL